jgi:hypothetical protein
MRKFYVVYNKRCDDEVFNFDICGEVNRVEPPNNTVGTIDLTDDEFTDMCRIALEQARWQLQIVERCIATDEAQP